MGALAGMTSVLLVTFLSQARIFLAMARDGLLPHSIFGVVHDRFRTPHRSTMLTGSCICLVSGFLPIRLLEEMVSIGTLMAFALVCASVLMLRITRPEAAPAVPLSGHLPGGAAGSAGESGHDGIPAAWTRWLRSGDLVSHRDGHLPRLRLSSQSYGT